MNRPAGTKELSGLTLVNHNWNFLRIRIKRPDLQAVADYFNVFKKPLKRLNYSLLSINTAINRGVNGKNTITRTVLTVFLLFCNTLLIGMILDDVARKASPSACQNIPHVCILVTIHIFFRLLIYIPILSRLSAMLISTRSITIAAVFEYGFVNRLYCPFY
jgi:hypothetical protein